MARYRDGVNLKGEASAGGLALAGKQFVLTGALEAMTRTSAKEMIEAKGGRVTSTVTKKTDYLVVGTAPGSKAKKAEELKIKVLTEKEFGELIGE